MKDLKKRDVTLSDLLTEKLVTLKVEEREGTYRNYFKLKNYIERRYGVLLMSQITPQWAAKFHSNMKNEGKSAATIKSYFAMLQAITNYGAYVGATKGDTKLSRSKPYELDKVKLERSRKRNGNFLTKDEMLKLWDKFEELENVKRGPKKWIGLFLASYLCNGANFADLLRLKYDNEYFSSNRKLFGFYREKVKRTSGAYIRVPITDRLKHIIDVIGDGEQKGGFVFGSFLRDTDVNNINDMTQRIMFINQFTTRVLRKQAPYLGIRPDVSVGFARHSYATILNHQGGNYALIEKCLGHVLGGVADNYIGEASIEKLFELNNMLF